MMSVLPMLGAADAMATKITTLYPEIVIFVAAFLCMILGLSPNRTVRRFTAGLAVASLLGGILIALLSMGNPAISPLVTYVKIAVCTVGVLLLLAAIELPDELADELKDSETFDPGRTQRGEFYGFMLLSLIGVMLCANADDLIWLFLALELVSLPTYVMVSTTKNSPGGPEAGVKYFFLGALAAAIFLYGFALIYGATGATNLQMVSESFQAMLAAGGGGLSGMAIMGLVLAIVGICFKIAAVPMHFYAADVYQGAATPVTAFLAFVPKTAGFLALIVLLSAIGWPLDRPVAGTDSPNVGGAAIISLLYVIAVLTMFMGNTLALRTDNVKRVLAYSSIAHTGYMVIGLVAGSAMVGSDRIDGVGAVLFYLLVYGVMNVGAFVVLGLLKKDGEEAETYDDLRGLVQRRPLLAAIMAACVFSLAGLPPLVGFFGKVYLFGAAITAGHIWLAVFGVINSAIAAVYYLRIIGVCFLTEADDRSAEPVRLPLRLFAGVLSMLLVVALTVVAGALFDATAGAATQMFEPDTGPTEAVTETVAESGELIAADPD